MRRVLGIIASALLVFFATAASATPLAGSSVDPSGDTATATLAAGQLIFLTIDISNLNGDLVRDVSLTLIFQGDQVDFLSGVAIAEVLVGGPLSAPTSLGRIVQPHIKIAQPNLPGFAGDIWLQAFAYAGLGTDGTGPDIAAVQLLFQVTGAAGTDQIEFILTETPGDIISGTPILNGAVINVVPVPGTALLMGLGLAGLGAGGRFWS